MVVFRCLSSVKKCILYDSGSLIKRCVRIECRRFKISRYSNQYQQNVNVLPLSKTSLVVKPFLFTLAVGSGSFIMATILQYETIRSDYLKGAAKHFQHMNKKSMKFRQKLNTWWNALHSGEKTAAGIIALNLGVFLLWRIPACQRTLSKWFLATPKSGLSLPMLLCCFSHIEPWHFLCNMVVFWSFAPVIHDMLGREQFLAFFITGAGCRDEAHGGCQVYFSYECELKRKDFRWDSIERPRKVNLVAGCFERVTFPGLVSGYFSHISKLVSRSYVPSLGASGCILAVLGAVCVANPDARLSILFLPFFSFSASKALIGLVAFDLAGLLFRWRMFDHAAHLGGIIFGSWYVVSGHKYLWDKRQIVLRKWHEFRQHYTK